MRGASIRRPPLLMLALLLAAPEARASTIDRQQLSNNGVIDAKPRVAGSLVAWQRGTGSGSEIVVSDGTDTGPVTANALHDFDPELSEELLIWKRSTDGVSCTLQARDLLTTETVGSSFPCDRDIRVAGSHAIWTDPATGSADDVFLSTDRDAPEQLGRAFVDEDAPRVGDVLGAPRAIWLDPGGLRYWNGEDDPEEISSGDVSGHQIQGARAVWVEPDGGGDDVFLFDGSAVVQLTDNDYDDGEPQVAGVHVVWRGEPDGGDGEIFHFDGTTVERITDDDHDDRDPQVSIGPDGVTIAWVKDEGDDDVWMFDGCESTRVNLGNSVEDRNPSLSGRRVAWEQGLGSSTEVWTATVTCDFECGNGEVEGEEECDDGNTAAGDGCSEACLAEFCGNGRVDAGEECDDGNTAAGDGCDEACLLECGNGTTDPGEACDDGDTENLDGCDANCQLEICGNAVTQPHLDEECDDGNAVDGDGCTTACLDEDPAPLAHQRCIDAMNDKGAALARKQLGVSLECLEDAAAGRASELGPSGTAQGCLADDPDGKAAAAQAKTVAAEAKRCDPADLPGFAYLGAAAVNAAGEAEPIALAADLFGADLDLAVIPRAVDARGAKCQRNVLMAANALVQRLFKLAVREKELLLAEKPDGSLARTDEALELALLGYVRDDAAGKIAAKEAAIREAARASCRGVTLDAAFPGCAPSAGFGALGGCAAAASRCRFCRALDAFDGLAIDCDDLDDGDAANRSCP